MRNYLIKAERQKAKGKTFYFLLFTSYFFLVASNVAAGSDVNAAEPNTSAETAVKQAKAKVAVTVNGVDILESDIETQVKSQFEKMGAQVPPAFAEQYKKQLRQQALERVIIEK